jgi:hypothetical protein
MISRGNQWIGPGETVGHAYGGQKPLVQRNVAGEAPSPNTQAEVNILLGLRNRAI